jgi:simple sugar transport system ATP-binding protein
MAVLFISSEMDEVVRLSDRIVVMRDRAKVGELPAGTDEHAVYALIAGQAA